MNANEQEHWSALQEGQEIPTGFSMKLDMRRLVLEASGTQDFYEVHYDRDFAQGQQGVPDIFANTMFLNAMMERTLTDWIGSDGQILTFDMEMRKMVFLGDTMTTKGIITEKRLDQSEQRKIFKVNVWIETATAGVTTKAETTIASPVQIGE